MLIAAIGVFLAIDMVYLVIITGVPQTRIVAYEIQLVCAMDVAVFIQGWKGGVGGGVAMLSAALNA